MTPLLALNHVSKRFGGLTAVDDVSMSIRQGEIYGLIGPNGAGKTTTFYMVVGIVPRDAGRIVIDEEDIS
uniref:ATP-binding cassette domain-containing protein n=1 Tax=Escherichia coli TaxID=562 RepID=UPI000E2E6C66